MVGVAMKVNVLSYSVWPDGWCCNEGKRTVVQCGLMVGVAMKVNTVLLYSVWPDGWCCNEGKRTVVQCMA